MAEPVSAKEVREFCRQKNYTYSESSAINPLIELGFVEISGPKVPNR